MSPLEALREFLSHQNPRPSSCGFSPEQRLELFREGLLEIAAYQRGGRQTVLEGAAREFRWRGLLDELDQALGRAGARAVVFKGGAALEGLYPRCGLRPLSDLDLVCEPHVPPLLESLGFVAAPRHPWVYTRDGFQLDLHAHPLSRLRHAFRWDLRRAMQRSLPRSACHGLYRFQTEDELLVALIHAGKHAYSRWIWLVDIALLLQRCDPDRLEGLLRDAGALRYLDYARWLLTTVQGQEQSGPRLSLLERTFLRACLHRRASESWGMLLPLLSIRSPRQALYYLRGALASPHGKDWRTRARELWALTRSAWRASSSPRHSRGS